MRRIASGTLAALRGRSKQPVFLIEAEFRTALVRFWTGCGKLIWRGQEWSAPSGARNGALLTMDMISEVAGMEATGIKFVLSGLRPDLLDYAADELRIAKRCTVYLGYVSESNPSQLVDDPVKAFKGWMDASEVELSGGEGKITLLVESWARRMKVVVNRLLTAEDQRIDFPNDTAFRYMNQIPNWKGKWGSQQIAAAPSGGGGGRPRWFDPEDGGGGGVGRIA